MVAIDNEYAAYEKKIKQDTQQKLNDIKTRKIKINRKRKYKWDDNHPRKKIKLMKKTESYITPGAEGHYYPRTPRIKENASNDLRNININVVREISNEEIEINGTIYAEEGHCYPTAQALPEDAPKDLRNNYAQQKFRRKCRAKHIDIHNKFCHVL